MTRLALTASLLAAALAGVLSPAAADSIEVLIRGVQTREISVHNGGVDVLAPKQVATREITVSAAGASADPFALIGTREISVAMGDAVPPPAITDLGVEVSPTGDRLTLDWGAYDQWAVGDIDRFEVYLSDAGPINSIPERAPDHVAPADSTRIEIDGLAPLTDHYILVVPVDVLGHYDPAVAYSAAYVLSPQVGTREITVGVGGQETEPRYRQVATREVTAVNVSDAPPPPIANLQVDASATGDAATLDWSGYDPWAVGDIDHFAVYQSDSGPIFDITGLMPLTLVSGELLGLSLTGLTPFTDHYFAVVPVDGLGQREPQVAYAATYILSPQVATREISVAVGGEAEPGYRQVATRELSVVGTDSAPPAPVTGIGSGFSVETSRVVYGSVEMDWTSYNEVAQRDVAVYRIYVSPAYFERIDGMQPFASVPAGIQHHVLGGLPGNAIRYFAVVAEDALGNRDPTVRAHSAQVSIAGVGEVLDLRADSGADALSFRWAPPENASAFLVGFRLYFDGAEAPLELPADASSWRATGLAAATGYPLRLTTVDIFGQESDGSSVLGVTWLPNPTGLVLRGDGDGVVLSWSAAQPAALVDHYALYSAAAPITDVAGLTPFTTRTGTSASLGGFDAIRDNHYAVATVNLSGGTDPRVTSVDAATFEDLAPPSIDAVSFNGVPLADGSLLTRPGQLAVSASDPAGITRVDFSIDGALRAVDATAADGLTADWAIDAESDGGHRLAIVAVDGYGNRAAIDFDLTIALAPPPAPVITEPPSDRATNEPEVLIRGTASADAEAVTLYRDGSPLGAPVPVSYGDFNGRIRLVDGENRISARAENRGGLGEPSPVRNITLDLSIPQAPIGLYARAREGGAVALSWGASSESRVIGYGVYRAQQPFTAIDQAQRLDGGGIEAAAFTDLPPSDGPWYYRVTAIDRFGTEGPPSNQASATADRVPPRALAIDYLPLGAYDPDGNRFGVGQVEVTVQLSEPVAATPFLTYAADGGVPQSVALTWRDETSYLGTLSITEGTPSGISYAVFSARDAAGNRGTEVLTGDSLIIDTDGPVATDPRITPADPVLNDPTVPTTLAITFGLDEPLADGAVPTLSASAPSLGEVPVAIALQQQDARWHGSLSLPPEAGADGPERFALAFAAQDRLGNIGTAIQGPTGIQVYQGELPPPETPTGLTGTALPGGEVVLRWTAVADAVDYEIHRAPGDTDPLVPVLRSGGTTEWIDQPGADGTYRYAVASVRQANGQEGISAPSEPVTVKADATAPAAPTDLSLALRSTGVEATWSAPADADPLTYRLYALPGAGLGALDPAAPTLDGITATNAVDPAPPAPENGLITYLVTAVDPAGNGSDNSAWQTLNAELLPVVSLSVEQIDVGFPRIAWGHVNAVDGFDLYLGERASGLKLNHDGPLVGTDFEDSGWNGGERGYSVVAVDGAGNESLPRSLRLPDLDLDLALGADSRIRRGLMNRVSAEVRNDGTSDAADVVLEVGLAGLVHVSAPETIPAGEARTLSAVVGGYADLPDLTDLTIAATQAPRPGESVRIVRSAQLEVGDGLLPMELAARDLTRGGIGALRLRIENGAAVPMQLVTATARGAEPSDDVRLRLTDLDGNLLSQAALETAVGPMIETLADGRSVATIAPGERFTSDWLALPIPEAAPDTVLAILDIDRLHYRLGEADAVSIAGGGTQAEVTLTDTPYVGELTAIEPAQSLGGAPVRISGRAVDRVSGEPVPRVALNLVVGNAGFERVFEMFTDEQGAFAFDYQPLSTDAGELLVSVVHPQLSLRPQQGSFSVGRVFIEPASQRLRLARDSERRLELQLRAGDGFPVTGLKLQYLPADQPFGDLDPGIIITPDAPIDLAAGATARLGIGLGVGADALGQGSIRLRALADQGGDLPLAMARIDYQAIDGGAALYPSRSYLELGAAPGERASAELLLLNQGLRAIDGVSVALLDATTEAPIDWAFLSSEAQIGTLAIGAAYPVAVSIAPDEALDEAVHELVIRVDADNLPRFDIPVYAYVTRGGVGDALFHVSDIYTATLDADGEPIPGLAGARVELQHELFGNINAQGRTDAAGEVLFTDLPAGRYLFRVSAPDHADAQGRLSIAPGATEAREVLLDYDLISLEWSVTEISIQDRYEIRLALTYETDVPAPVVVIEPPGITLPEMAPGQVLRGQLTITNYGLVRADGVSFTPPADDQHFDYDFQAEVPASLEAKQRITLPYRITALRPLDAADEPAASGGAGGCGYAAAARLAYRFSCANGVVSGGGSSFRISANVSGSCGGSWTWGGLPSGTGGAAWRPVAWPLIPCPPDCEGDCCDRSGSGGGPGGGE